MTALLNLGSKVMAIIKTWLVTTQTWEQQFVKTAIVDILYKILQNRFLAILLALKINMFVPGPYMVLQVLSQHRHPLLLPAFMQIPHPFLPRPQVLQNQSIRMIH